MIAETTKRPRDLPAWKPFLRGYFWVRKHNRGWCICWHAWNARLGWGVCWGIGFNNLQEAKAVRRFLNRKVSRGIGYGLTMDQVVQFIESGIGPEQRDWGKWVC
jgi:hypothetical protein